MGPEDIKGRRLPGDPPRSLMERAEDTGREVIRASFLEALGDYIDARIDFRGADPEWRSSREIAQAADRLETALTDVLKHGV